MPCLRWSFNDAAKVLGHEIRVPMSVMRDPNVGALSLDAAIRKLSGRVVSLCERTENQSLTLRLRYDPWPHATGHHPNCISHVARHHPYHSSCAIIRRHSPATYPLALWAWTVFLSLAYLSRQRKSHC